LAVYNKSSIGDLLKEYVLNPLFKRGFFVSAVRYSRPSAERWCQGRLSKPQRRLAGDRVRRAGEAFTLDTTWAIQPNRSEQDKA